MSESRAARCTSCNDTGHVCENHPTRPWGGMCCDQSRTFTGRCGHGTCHCGGAGQPCPACCTPIPTDGSTPIGNAFVPDRQCARPAVACA